jgi:hypothetical protein
MGDEQIVWKDEPEEHNFPAALDYLSMIALPETAAAVVDRFRMAAVEYRKAKDILRASRLPLLPRDNPHVKRHLSKVVDGKSVSPVLLVRGDVFADRPLHIADGYHRVCAAYWLDENCLVACRLVDFPSRSGS